MAKSSTYSMKNVQATLDGQSVVGFWDGDDAVTVEMVDDVGTGMVGADGSSIFSHRAGNAHTITLRLQHTSPAHRMLQQKWARQRAVGVRVAGFPFSHIDVDSGEGGTADDCYIQAAPSSQQGTEAAVREWVLWTGFYTPNVPNA